ncbi:MAG TPA: sulfotransferase domain-containing protein [Candidatus Dormibacteraeota bacterium]|nr:sulfotransferase domain-containing protein [Candidatus Dormibacteraeota bacterium]
MSLRAHTKDSRIKGYVKAVAAAAFGRKSAGRNLTVFPNDLFLVSYYRSGSTWSRFLAGNLLNPDEAITFANVERRVPPIYLWPDRVLRTLPRVMKSHEAFDPRYPRVLYIVRDPRDVAVSFYYYALKMRIIPDGYAMDDFVTRFLKPDIVDYADRNGSWEDHVLSWIRLRRGKPGFCITRYEDLQSDPAREVARWAPLLGINPTPEAVARAVSLSSASNMRSLEEKQSKDWGVTKNSRQDISFVRDAKAGGWRQKLSEKSILAIEKAWGPTIEELGYELTTASPKLNEATVLT